MRHFTSATAQAENVDRTQSSSRGLTEGSGCRALDSFALWTLLSSPGMFAIAERSPIFNGCGLLLYEVDTVVTKAGQARRYQTAPGLPRWCLGAGMPSWSQDPLGPDICQGLPSKSGPHEPRRCLARMRPPFYAPSSANFSRVVSAKTWFGGAAAFLDTLSHRQAQPPPAPVYRLVGGVFSQACLSFDKLEFSN